MSLLTDVHKALSVPNGCFQYSIVKGSYEYYHYGCDGQNDMGWGCGYRTLQTLCSWIKHSCSMKEFSNVPSLLTIQETLVAIGDKPASFVNSREWIGSFEICLFLDHCYDIPCKIIHIQSGHEIESKFEELMSHFEKFGSPVMIGGNSDASSKALLGVAMSNEKKYFLILDPHFSGNAAERNHLISNGWISWRGEELFMENSFYNFCLPQHK
ncbi:ufm1-specific protease 1-like [Xenia sp. Carnegie-2017]|uniref:ufm1-specific protease 1-like n=1 Tax=Xenia sp. Carnegie-2017 TaxID=2897299 RepID=UPI001F050127|nr:ufm1-specific protease 1-like [Xenia sp. Carnegie-2017]